MPWGVDVPSKGPESWAYVCKHGVYKNADPVETRATNPAYQCSCQYFCPHCAVGEPGDCPFDHRIMWAIPRHLEAAWEAVEILDYPEGTDAIQQRVMAQLRMFVED